MNNSDGRRRLSAAAREMLEQKMQAILDEAKAGESSMPQEYLDSVRRTLARAKAEDEMMNRVEV